MKLASIEAENSVLAALITNSASIRRIEGKVEAKDFSTPFNQAAFELIQEDPNLSDVISLSERLIKQGFEEPLTYLTDLCLHNPGGSNIAPYAEIVADKAKIRRLMAKMDDIAAEVHESHDKNADEIVSEAQQSILSLTEGDSTGEIETASKCLEAAVKEWNRRADLNGKIDGLATGWRDIDTRLCGVRAGDLFIIAARPSMGKTALAMQFAGHIAIDQQKPVAVFSLEMSKQQLIDRMAACVGGIPYGVLRSCEPAKFGEHSHAINVAARKIKDSKLYIDDTGGLHINQICARARRVKAMNGEIGAVFVDHIGLAASEGQSREREIANITWKLKMLAKELGCPVIALSQLNRGVEQRTNKRPMMSDLRDSGSIEQDADTVALLYRDDYYNERSDNPGTIEVIFGKLRDGEVGTDYLQSELSKMRMLDQEIGYQPVESQPEPQRRGF